MFDNLLWWGTWQNPDLGRPIAAPLERCAELLGVDLATIRELVANVVPYIRVDGTAPKVRSLMQLERQLRPKVYRWRRAATWTVGAPDQRCLASWAPRVRPVLGDHRLVGKARRARDGLLLKGIGCRVDGS